MLTCKQAQRHSADKVWADVKTSLLTQATDKVYADVQTSTSTQATDKVHAHVQTSSMAFNHEVCAGVRTRSLIFNWRSLCWCKDKLADKRNWQSLCWCANQLTDTRNWQSLCWCTNQTTDTRNWQSQFDRLGNYLVFVCHFCCCFVIFVFVSCCFLSGIQSSAILEYRVQSKYYITCTHANTTLIISIHADKAHAIQFSPIPSAKLNTMLLAQNTATKIKGSPHSGWKNNK